MNDEDFVKYLGGFLDGDGSIFWSKGKLCLNFSQSEKTVLDFINTRYNNLFRFTCRTNKSSNRTQFQISKTGTALYPVLLDLQKGCIIKHPQICKALEFLQEMNRTGNQEKRDEIGELIKKMNHEHYNKEFINLRPYSSINIQYISGLFDTDGCVCIRKNYGCYAKITQKNDTKILKIISEMYIGSRYTASSYAVIFEKNEVLIAFLTDMIPYLIYKLDQVLDTLKFLNSDTLEEKEELRVKVTDAKKFDLDPEKYKQELVEVFTDLENNYTKTDLMLGKKLSELQKTRNNITWNKQIFTGTHLNIKPKLIFCESRDQNAKWLYYRNKTSSIYHGGNIGRTVRILVQDETSQMYIGVMSLGSDFYNIKARDDYIKRHTTKDISEYLIYIANLTCCVPLQPFGYNTNGGKLLLKLAFSKEVSEYWKNKYGTPLLAITTLGVNGKSVLYDRLKEVKLIGYTVGKSSTLHIPTEVIEKTKILSKHLNLTNIRHGTVDMIKTLFRKMNIATTFDKHINKKGVYFGYIHDTKFEKLDVDTSSIKNTHKITDEWRVRWAQKRLSNITVKSHIELYDKNDDIFKNIKIYELPSSRNIGRVFITPKPLFVKEQRTKEPLILQKLSDIQLIELMTKKGVLKTQEASDEIKLKYDIIIQRSQISKLWIGEIIPNEKVTQSDEYKSALEITKRRVYTGEKSQEWKDAISSKNRKRAISDETMLKIMKHKLESISATKCGELYNISRTTIQNIWSGKMLPQQCMSEEYQSLLEI